MLKRRKRTLGRGLWRLSLASSGLLLVSGYLVLANPFNWFVAKSERFSEEAFLELRPGGKVADAIALLGAPIDVEPVSGVGVGGADGSRYVFHGIPPAWLLSYEEAWVVATADGTIVARVWNEEP